MANFATTPYPTPFGYFDSTSQFQTDADAMVTFVFRKLGEDVLSVELTKKQVWACFEEATRELNGWIIEYQAKSNLANLLGTPTGSLLSNGQGSINLTNVYIGQNLEFLDRMAEPYANIIGYGSTQNTISGSITLSAGIQDYDLYTQLVDGNGTPLFNLQPTGSAGKMRVHEVFHSAPVQYVFNSNLASNFVAQGLPVESYIPDTRFYVLPLFEDVLRAGMLESASRVRRSHYTYKISGRNIRVFPTPNNLQPGYNDRLWIRVSFPSSVSPFPSGSFLDASGSVNAATTTANTFYGASNPANIPFGLLDYNSLNQWAKNWITQLTLALCRELLGLVRSKMKTIPIPGATLELNGPELVTQGREDKERLLTNLKDKLESLTYDAIAKQEAEKAESIANQLKYLPIPPQWAITQK